ncbi:hypothetical protein [Thalassobacillus pellis]|uniref:hypothetical protein n=1 Tax=Thalassobacillus pellis TaxID=748008 RepID=UPI00195F369B|nr:hypothetical protein [Thalassobacillus pellis]MBM7552980.1 amino acid transporter [Thalassobacillus pellis]
MKKFVPSIPSIFFLLIIFVISVEEYYPDMVLKNISTGFFFFGSLTIAVALTFIIRRKHGGMERGEKLPNRVFILPLVVFYTILNVMNINKETPFSFDTLMYWFLVAITIYLAVKKFRSVVL